jgi:hypothetical protein
MPDAFAYRASAEFAQAIRRRFDEIDEFRNAIAIPWDETHPDTVSLWASNSLDLPCDRRCVGFADDGGDVPAGLSRSKRRGYFSPARGKAGDPWRAALTELNRKPMMGELFRRFGVPDHVLDFNAGMSYRAVIVVAPDAVWLRYGREISTSPHLAPARMSEFYAAVEAREAAAVSP